MGYRNRVAHHLRRIRCQMREYSWRMGTKLLDRATVSTAQGRFTVYTADQVVGRQLYIHREFESAWVEAALRFLRASARLPVQGQGTVVDIGANLGVISIGMLRQKEFAKAIAIEADPANYSLLVHNARQNKLDASRYLCVPCAVSDQLGELEFELSENNFGDHRVRRATPQLAGAASSDRFQESLRNTIRVKAIPLDDLLAELPRAMTQDIALLWIDTQGHEGCIFRGGRELFHRNVPVACEIWPYGILRSGLCLDAFCELAREFWSSYWVLRGGRTFVRYGIAELPSLLDELGSDGNFDNVLFTA